MDIPFAELEGKADICGVRWQHKEFLLTFYISSFSMELEVTEHDIHNEINYD